MGTNFQAGQYDHCQHISIHVPREGHDTRCDALTTYCPIFQSTCPARGTTNATGEKSKPITFQSTCPARGTTYLCADISIKFHVFQSTCPARGTTLSLQKFRPCFTYFNPRAPRGARHCDAEWACRSNYFNPRAPRGARRYCAYCTKAYGRFQSTCPARGTTQTNYYGSDIYQFQSTCPARGTTR